MSHTRVIVNPLSGEQITIRRTAAETGGAVLDWELLLAPGGRVPSSQAHPELTETFTVLEGLMKFRVGWRRLVVHPGQQVCVPAGTVHHFANAAASPALIAVESRPALAMEELLETAAALAREQHAAGRRLPRLADLALFMADFEHGSGPRSCRQRRSGASCAGSRCGRDDTVWTGAISGCGCRQ